MNISEFSALPLPGSLLEGLSSLGFVRLLPVQAQSLPAILAGRDVLVQAETGSGKTLAFALGMLAGLNARLEVQALAVCPTRELAEQVSGQLRRLARCTPNVKVLALCGGVPFAPQRASLRQGAHVVVGTPGRLEEHVRKGSLKLDQLKVLVLDEADRILDMGFEPQLAGVVRGAPAERQTLLFSATYPDSISELSQAYQRDALRIEVAGRRAGDAEAAVEGHSGAVEQTFVRVSVRQRVAALAAWLSSARPESTLVFCNMRSECGEVTERLHALGWVAAALHGDLPQRERQHVLRLFANGSCSVLAVTDVAARGWDIPELAAVVNLGLPRDPDIYLHRMGRTGRMGRAGRVVSFVAEEDAAALRALERAQARSVELEPVPSRAPPVAGPPLPARVTLLLSAGKNKKLRPGDVLGALTGEGGLDGAEVGVIQIDESVSYVAVAAHCGERALQRLQVAGIKGRSVRARLASLSLRDSAATAPDRP
jgi:ATP-dependent RNA helicase DbpA